jgi:site-specific recombinase XerD
LFVDYLTVEKKFALSKLSFEHLRADIISGFLDWLQVERHCSSSTRNQRLAALKSFAKYAGLSDISQASLRFEIAKVPVQKSEMSVVEFLSEDALKALLAQPGANRIIDIRNRFFMILMYDTAARCQEMLDLRLRDFELETKFPYIYLHGKGNKTRTVPLMAKTVEHYLLYLAQFHQRESRDLNDLVFYTVIHGQKNPMSPDSVAHFMKQYGESARTMCRGVPMRVHPHQLRHTRAIHLYRGGMPLALLSEILGHSNIATTQIYAYADTEMKRKAIQKACNELGGTHDEKPLWENNDEMIRRLYGLS